MIINNDNDDDDNNNDNDNQTYLVRVTINSKAEKTSAVISGLNWNLKCSILVKGGKQRKTLGA